MSREHHAYAVELPAPESNRWALITTQIRRVELGAIVGAAASVACLLVAVYLKLIP